MSLKCVSNLRQFYAAEVLYANDYKGTVPGNGRSPSWTRMPAFFNELTQSSNRQSAAEMVLCPTCPNTADLFTETLSYGSDGWIKLYDTPDATNVLFAGDTYANPEGPIAARPISLPKPPARCRRFGSGTWTLPTC